MAGQTARRSASANWSPAHGRRPARSTEKAAAHALAPTISTRSSVAMNPSPPMSPGPPALIIRAVPAPAAAAPPPAGPRQRSAEPRPALLLPIRRLLPLLPGGRAALRRGVGVLAAAERGPADRHLLLHCRGHQLRRGRVPRPGPGRAEP